MKRFGMAVLGVVIATAGVLSAVSARADITTYSSNPLFLAAAPGVDTQDFTFMDTRYGARSLATGNNVDQFTNRLRILPGDIRPGLTIGINTSGADDLAIVGTNYFSSNTDPMAFASNGMKLELNFGPTVNAVGLDVLGAGQQLFADVLVNVYSDTSSLLGSYVVPGAPFTGSGKFFGVTTGGADKIGRVEILPSTGTIATTSLIEFGQVSSVPEPGGLALCVTLAGTGIGLAGHRVRRSRVVTFGHESPQPGRGARLRQIQQALPPGSGAAACGSRGHDRASR